MLENRRTRAMTNPISLNRDQWKKLDWWYRYDVEWNYLKSILFYQKYNFYLIWMSKELSKKFLWMRGCIADSFGLKEDQVNVVLLRYRTPSSATKPTDRRSISFLTLKARQKSWFTIKHRTLDQTTTTTWLILSYFWRMVTPNVSKTRQYGS